MKRILKFSVLVGAGLVIGGFVSFSAHSSSTKTTISIARKSQPQQYEDAPSFSAKALMRSMDEKHARYAVWAKDKEEFASAEDSAKKLPYKLKIPTDTSKIGKPSKVYVDWHQGQAKPTVYLFYGADFVTGLRLIVELNPTKFDPQRSVSEMVAAKQRDELKTNNVPFMTEVNGYPAMAWEPGYNLIEGDRFPKTGSIMWQEDDGVQYNLNGTAGQNATSVGELLSIANSIK